MKRLSSYLLVFSAGVLSAAALWMTKQEPARVSAAQTSPLPKVSKDFEAVVTSVGRVEPVSEEVRVGSSIGGKLARVLVEEGDNVKKGQVLAILENGDFVARVSIAEAQVKQAEAQLRRVINGSREQERREAWAAVKAAEAMMENAKADRDRLVSLYRSGDISRSEADRAEREFRVANSRYDEAKERHSFVDADAREEDRARAEADVAYARARLSEAQALLERTMIRSPIAGSVLRKHMRAGEAIPDSMDAPIVTIGDNSQLRVRAEIDEADIAKVRVGQRAYVTADAHGKTKFWGRVVRVGLMMGTKQTRTDRPAERVDKKTLETLIELDPGQQLPAGLRVDAFIG
jgi:ABC exporter DevB family membrane fusion protein